MAMPTSSFADAGSSPPEGRPVELAQAQAQAPAGEAVGQVSAVEGAVTITRTDGSKVTAAAGTPIFQGDLVETAQTGAIGITFADNSTFSLADNGSMVIDQMIYDSGSQTGKSAISVAQGVFTFVSGQIAKTDVDAMIIKTPVAVIGIRGTAGGGKAGPEGTPNTFTMFQDPAGGIGEMHIRTNGGNVIFSQALQTTQVSSAFLPPLKPIILPPSVAAQFYAKATNTAPTKPVIDKPAGDPGATGGPAGATDAPAAEKAAAEAFANALAQGGSLDQAIGAAAGAAATVALETALTQNPELFGTPAAAQAVLGELVAKSLGDLAGSLGTITLAGGAGGDILGPPLDRPPIIFIQFLPPPPPFFVLPPIFVRPPELPPDLPPPPPGFDEVLFGTTGNDTLTSSPGKNTQFIMVQGVNLGGTDQVFGGDGSDQLKFDNVTGIDAVYHQTGGSAGAIQGTISYAGAVTGSITLDSIEQIFFDNGLEGFQRLDFDASDTGHFGYLRAGTSLDDDGMTNPIISLAGGTTLAGSLGMVTTDANLLLGGILFGNAGNDILNGSAEGDIILGGTGNDTLNGVGGDDLLRGGAGNDQLNGGLGRDTIILDSGSDIVRYVAVNDGNALGSLTIANADSIIGFTRGLDTVRFDDSSIALNGTTVVSVATNGAVFTGDVNGVFYINDATVADLGSFASVATAIGGLTGVATGDIAIFLVRNSAGTQTGLYAFQDNGGANGTVESNELALLGVVDAAIDNTDATIGGPA